MVNTVCCYINYAMNNNLLEFFHERSIGMEWDALPLFDQDAVLQQSLTLIEQLFCVTGAAQFLSIFYSKINFLPTPDPCNSMHNCMFSVLLKFSLSSSFLLITPRDDTTN